MLSFDILTKYDESDYQVSPAEWQITGEYSSNDTTSCARILPVIQWVAAIPEGEKDLDDEARASQPVISTSPDVEDKMAADVQIERKLMSGGKVPGLNR